MCHANSTYISNNQILIMDWDRLKFLHYFVHITVIRQYLIYGLSLPQMGEFQVPQVVLEWGTDGAWDWWISAASAVMRLLYRNVTVKREWISKALDLLVIYVLPLTYGHEIWVMTERTRHRWPKCVSSEGWLGLPLQIGSGAQTPERSSE